MWVLLGVLPILRRDQILFGAEFEGDLEPEVGVEGEAIVEEVFEVGEGMSEVFADVLDGWSSLCVGSGSGLEYYVVIEGAVMVRCMLLKARRIESEEVSVSTCKCTDHMLSSETKQTSTFFQK